MADENHINNNLVDETTHQAHKISALEFKNKTNKWRRWNTAPELFFTGIAQHATKEAFGFFAPSEFDQVFEGRSLKTSVAGAFGGTAGYVGALFLMLLFIEYKKHKMRQEINWMLNGYDSLSETELSELQTFAKSNFKNIAKLIGAISFAGSLVFLGFNLLGPIPSIVGDKINNEVTNNFVGILFEGYLMLELVSLATILFKALLDMMNVPFEKSDALGLGLLGFLVGSAFAASAQHHYPKTLLARLCSYLLPGSFGAIFSQIPTPIHAAAPREPLIPSSDLKIGIVNSKP